MTRARLTLIASLVATTNGCVDSLDDDADAEAVGVHVSALTSGTEYGALFMGSYFGGNYGVDVRSAVSRGDGSKSLDFALDVVPGLYSYVANGYSSANVPLPSHFRSSPRCHTSFAFGQAEVRRGNAPSKIVARSNSKACGPFTTDVFVIGSDYEPGHVPAYAVMAVRLDNPTGDLINYGTSFNTCLSTTYPTTGPVPGTPCTTQASSSATAVDFYVYARPGANGNRGKVDAWGPSGLHNSEFIISGSSATDIAAD